MSLLNLEIGLFPCYSEKGVKESCPKSLNTFIFNFRLNGKTSSVLFRVILTNEIPVGIREQNLVSVKTFVCINY